MGTSSGGEVNFNQGVLPGTAPTIGQQLESRFLELRASATSVNAPTGWVPPSAYDPNTVNPIFNVTSMTPSTFVDVTESSIVTPGGSIGGSTDTTVVSGDSRPLAPTIPPDSPPLTPQRTPIEYTTVTSTSTSGGGCELTFRQKMLGYPGTFDTTASVEPRESRVFYISGPETRFVASSGSRQFDVCAQSRNVMFLTEGNARMWASAKSVARDDETPGSFSIFSNNGKIFTADQNTITLNATTAAGRETLGQVLSTDSIAVDAVTVHHDMSFLTTNQVTVDLEGGSRSLNLNTPGSGLGQLNVNGMVTTGEMPVIKYIYESQGNAINGFASYRNTYPSGAILNDSNLAMQLQDGALRATVIKTNLRQIEANEALDWASAQSNSSDVSLSVPQNNGL